METLIQYIFGEREMDIVEYKKIRLNDKLIEFFNYEDNYVSNQKYIYSSAVPLSLYEFYKLFD